MCSSPCWEGRCFKVAVSYHQCCKVLQTPHANGVFARGIFLHQMPTLVVICVLASSHAHGGMSLAERRPFQQTLTCSEVYRFFPVYR